MRSSIGGNHWIWFTDDRSLTVDGELDSGDRWTAITTTGTGNGVALDSMIVAHSLNLVSTGAVTESGSGAIDAKRLKGSAADAASLTSGENAITDLGTFTSGGVFDLTDGDGLTLKDTVNAGSQVIDLTAAGNLAIDGTIIGGTIDLAAAHKATEVKTGTIVATEQLNVTAGTGIKLTSKTNDIKTLGTDATGTGPNKVTL